MKHFNNNLHDLPAEVKTFIEVSPEDSHVILKLMQPSIDFSFSKFVTPYIFDKEFIFSYNKKITLQVAQLLSPYLVPDYQKLILQMERAIETKDYLDVQSVTNIIKGANEQVRFSVDESKQNAVLYFHKSFLGSFTHMGLGVHDLAQAVAHTYEKDSQESQYRSCLNDFRRTLIHEIFERYPDDLKGFEQIKSLSEIRRLLRI